MPHFHYHAVDKGERLEGVAQAGSRTEAAAQLRARGLLILSLREAAAQSQDSSHADGKPGRRWMAALLISGAEVESMLGQMGSLLGGGVPVVAALNAIQGQSRGMLRGVLAAIARRVRAGAPLSKSLRAEAPFVGETTLGLLAAGEANGTVAEMLRQAAALMKRVREVRSQILQVMAYPSIVALGAAGVAIYMVRVVFPKVLQFIQKQRSNVDLPAVSRALINVSQFMTDYGLYVMLAPVALIVAFVLVRRTAAGGMVIDRAMLSLPLLGKALRAASNALWTRVLGTLIRSGVDIVSAIDLVQRTLRNRHYKAQFQRVRDMVRRGRSLSDALHATELAKLCPLAPALVSVGEQAGGMDEGLLHVAADCEESLDRRTRLLAKLVEPAVFTVVGGMVGFVYFGFFLAMLAATRSAR